MQKVAQLFVGDSPMFSVELEVDSEHLRTGPGHQWPIGKVHRDKPLDDPALTKRADLRVFPQNRLGERSPGAGHPEDKYRPGRVAIGTCV